MQHDAKKYLFDILQAGKYIKQFVQGKSYNDYSNDILLRSAIERQFEIIGEALSQLIKVEPGIKDRISNVRKIINFRNVLIHGYTVITDEVVWGIVENGLPELLKEVDNLYNK